MYKVKYFVLLQFIVINVSFGQNTNGFKLLSEKDSTGIEFAHIFFDDKLVTYSDESGNFKIDLNSSFHILSIRHLSYQTKELTKNDLNNFNIILMQEKETLLDEVVISTRKKLKNHLLLPEKRAQEFFMKGLDVRFPYKFKNAVYVPYEFKKGAYTIQNIVFQSRKGHDDPNSKYIPFKVNLMTVDTITSLPKDTLFKVDLAVGKRENQKLLKVDISDYNIEFPKEGVFVVVSLYDQEYYESNGFTDRPGFGQTQITNSSKFFELFWLPGKNTWEEPFYSQDRIQCRNFGLEVVEYE